jgi:hypothetical protein
LGINGVVVFVMRLYEYIFLDNILLYLWFEKKMSSLPTIFEETTKLPFNVPLPKVVNFESSEPTLCLTKVSVSNLIAGFRKLVKKYDFNIEELKPVSQILKDVETQMLLTITQQQNVVSVKKSSIFRLLNTYRQMVKRVSFEVEELEDIAQAYYDVVGQVNQVNQINQVNQ